MSLNSLSRVSSHGGNHSPKTASRKVTAPLRFLKPQAEKPRFLSAAVTAGQPKFLFEFETHRVAIEDMRPLAGQLSLDHEGFELLQHRTSVQDLYDDRLIGTTYHAELRRLLIDHLGAEEVILFDDTRRSDDQKGAANPDGPRGPASHVHNDYTLTSGPQRVRDVLGDEVAEHIYGCKRRIAQVNVWRPIKGPVQRAPLAVADASSIALEDLHATEQIFPDRVGEIYNLAYNPAQRWYYASAMQPDEVLLIKGWDSAEDGRARFAPHGAFEPPLLPANAPPRESIETRALVIF